MSLGMKKAIGTVIAGLYKRRPQYNTFSNATELLYYLGFFNDFTFEISFVPIPSQH